MSKTCPDVTRPGHEFPSRARVPLHKMNTAATKMCDVTSDGDVFRFLCPHCDGQVEVEKQQVRCRIFRHATLKLSGRQLDPHAPRGQCEAMHAAGLVHGCAKPFMFHYGTLASGPYVTACGYI